jgi:hypothetical protein
MRKDKGSAFDLRKAGKSYREIERELGVPRSTLCAWFAGVEWSKHVEKHNTDRNISNSKERLATINKERVQKLASDYQAAEEKAAGEYELFKKEPLFAMGLMIYAIKGDKGSTHVIHIGNSEPYVQRVFNAFAAKYLSLQFRAGMSILSSTVLKKKVMKWLELCANDAAMV